MTRYAVLLFFCLPKGSNVVPFWAVDYDSYEENRSEPKRNYIGASGYICSYNSSLASWLMELHEAQQPREICGRGFWASLALLCRASRSCGSIFLKRL